MLTSTTTIATILARTTTPTLRPTISTQMMTTRVMNASTGAGIDAGATRANPTATTATTPTTASAIAGTTLKTTTTITSDPGILCFHHCNVKVFCFTLPHICPQCKTALDTHPGGGKRHKNKKRANNAESTATKGHNQLTNGDSNDRDHNDDGVSERTRTQERRNDKDSDEDGDYDDDDEDDDDSNENGFVSHIMASRLLPFRLPYPFVRANQYPCAIVLRPTTGDFLNDYNNTTDLHIAVTTSTGCVVEFDRHGLRRHRTDNMSDWWQCLLVGDVPEPWYDYWDQVLFETCKEPNKWTVSHYHEDKHNCYTFVLTFLQALTYDKLSEAATSKTTFCEKYIVPRTTTAGKYISLYRKLRDTGIYVHHTNHNKLRHAASHGKGAKQQMQQQHNKCNNIAMSPTKSALVSISHKHQQQQPKQPQRHQQQHQSQQHHTGNQHHSIIARPHSTLCTIEE